MSDTTELPPAVATNLGLIARSPEEWEQSLGERVRYFVGFNGAASSSLPR